MSIPKQLTLESVSAQCVQTVFGGIQTVAMQMLYEAIQTVFDAVQTTVNAILCQAAETRRNKDKLQ